MYEQDRRAEPRHRVSVRADVVSDGLRRRATVYDLGADGVFIRTNQPLAPGAMLGLTIYTPDDLCFLHADGQVIWTNLVDTESVPAGMGIRFTRVDPDEQERLRSQLDSLDS